MWCESFILTLNICKVGSKVSSVNLLEDDSYSLTMFLMILLTIVILLLVHYFYLSQLFGVVSFFILLTVNLLNNN